MRARSTAKIKGLILLLAGFLLTQGAAAGQDNEERQKLLHRRKLLAGRVEQLRQEQDFLLFQKAVYETDSKYVIVNLSEKTGQLRYKNRVLKEFPLFFVSSTVRRIKQGAVTLTGKIDGPGQRPSLIFGASFILEGKGPAGSAKSTIPRISLAKKDLISVLRGMEAGGRAYILHSR